MEARLPFAKMHGAGNDFIMVDARRLPAGGLTAARIAALCERRRGIGADGLIVVAPVAGADFAMTYYNADGGEAEMCGNGARCAVAFARRLGLAPQDECAFQTASGRVAGRWHAGEVAVTLTPPRDLRLNVTVADSPFAEHHVANTGVPHLVVPVADVGDVDVARWGPFLRRHAAFAPAGTNVNWVSPASPSGGPWRLRTYERGVEAETLACGTGASATALVLRALGRAASPVSLLTRGGDVLAVAIEGSGAGTRLQLRGPAVVSFEGEVGWHE